MSKFFKISILFVFLLTVNSNLFSQFSGGSGSKENPYLIKTKEDLNKVRDYLHSHFIQTEDIIFTEEDYKEGAAFYNEGQFWEPIASYPIKFSGTYDGVGHKIDYIKINRPDSGYVGLFGCIGLDTAKISNLSITNVDIVGGYSVGAIGELLFGLMENVNSSGKVNGYSEVGGLVGDIFDGLVVNSFSTADVEGKKAVGGFIGDIFRGTIQNCYALGSVTGEWRVGGLVGLSITDEVLENCYSMGDVKGIKSVGGFIGSIGGTLVKNCYSHSSVAADTNAGGFIGGSTKGIIIYCYSIGKVTGKVNVGGLVGAADSISISNSFWDVESSGISQSALGHGKSTQQMKDDDTYFDASWPFSGIWALDSSKNDGYPYLVAKVTAVEDSYATNLSELIVFPNPAVDYITVNCGSIGACSNVIDNGASPIAFIEIYDVMGMKMHTTPVETKNFSSMQQRIDVSEIAPGVYFLKIGGSVSRFIKK